MATTTKMNPAHARILKVLQDRILKVLRDGGTLTKIDYGYKLKDKSLRNLGTYSESTIHDMVHANLLHPWPEGQYRTVPPVQLPDEPEDEPRSEKPDQPITKRDYDLLMAWSKRRGFTPDNIPSLVKQHEETREFFDSLGGPERTLQVASELKEVLSYADELPIPNDKSAPAGG